MIGFVLVVGTEYLVSTPSSVTLFGGEVIFLSFYQVPIPLFFFLLRKGHFSFSILENVGTTEFTNTEWADDGCDSR